MMIAFAAESGTSTHSGGNLGRVVTQRVTESLSPTGSLAKLL